MYIKRIDFYIWLFKARFLNENQCQNPIKFSDLLPLSSLKTKGSANKYGHKTPLYSLHRNSSLVFLKSSSEPLHFFFYLFFLLFLQFLYRYFNETSFFIQAILHIFSRIFAFVVLISKQQWQFRYKLQKLEAILHLWISGCLAPVF